MDNSEKLYLEVLDARINGLNKRIAKLENNLVEKRIIISRDEKQIIALKKEIEKIEKEKKEFKSTSNFMYKDSLALDKLDSYYNSQDEKIKKVENQITDLKELKENLQTKSAKKRVIKRIKNKEEYIKKLKKRECRISGVQKTTLMSKRAILNLKNRMVSKQEANVDYYSSKLNDATLMKNSLDLSAKGIQGVKNKTMDRLYGVREKYYMKKQEKHVNLLKEMQSKKVGLVGGRAIMMSKNACNMMRNTRDLINRAINSKFGFDELEHASRAM